MFHIVSYVNYDGSSGHIAYIIVMYLIQDDPLCVAARKDCKTIVTGLWVDHSFDAGMPVDPTTVRFSILTCS